MLCIIIIRQRVSEDLSANEFYVAVDMYACEMLLLIVLDVMHEGKFTRVIFQVHEDGLELLGGTIVSTEGPGRVYAWQRKARAGDIVSGKF